MTYQFKTTFAATLIAGATALSTFSTATMAETKLVLSSWLPARHPVVAKAIKPWAKQVAEVTQGRVTIRVLSKPLGPPPAHFDMAADGVADITYGLHSFTKDDRFLRSRIGQFSFIGNNATEASKAYWNVYAGKLDAQKEHKGVKLLGLFVHGPGMFHNNKRKIETPADFKGLKIRTPGGYIAALAGDLGITTQFMGPGQVFEKLSRGVIDGVTFPIEAIRAFKLAGHLKYSMSVPGGMYNTSWFLVMNNNKWKGLSDADKKAVMAISGEAFANLVGNVWDASDKVGAAAIAKSQVEVHDASAAVLVKLKILAAKHEIAWSAAVKATGYDGAAALVEMRKQSGVN